MERDINKILEDLYKLDPSLRADEGRLLKVINLLEQETPRDAQIDAQFKADLAKLLQERASEISSQREHLESKPTRSPMRIFPWSIAVAAIAVVLVVWSGSTKGISTPSGTVALAPEESTSKSTGLYLERSVSKEAPATNDAAETVVMSNPVVADESSEEEPPKVATMAAMPAPATPQGATIPDDEYIFQVSLPDFQEVNKGDIITINWYNETGSYTTYPEAYISVVGTTPDGNVSLLEHLTVESTGSYNWTVPELDISTTYVIEVYTDRSLIGKSRPFVAGEQLIQLDNHKATKKIRGGVITITGSARKVYGEGEFDVEVTKHYGEDKNPIFQGYASAEGSDWMSEEWVPFTTIIDLRSYSASDVVDCNVDISFYRRNEKDGEPKEVLLTITSILTQTERCNFPE